MSEIGRYESASFAGFPGLRIGTTMALFHCSGTKPVVYDKLSSFRRLFLLDSVRLGPAVVVEGPRWCLGCLRDIVEC